MQPIFRTFVLGQITNKRDYHILELFELKQCWLEDLRKKDQFFEELVTKFSS